MPAAQADEAALSVRVALALARHRPPAAGGRGRPRCAEDGFAWPCPTAEILGTAPRRSGQLADRAAIRLVLTRALTALPGVPPDRAYVYAGTALAALGPVLAELEAHAAPCGVTTKEG